MPEDMDQNLLSAIERLKKDEATDEDFELIGDAIATGKIEINPSSEAQTIQQAGGTNFGEDNEIRVTGSVIGTQTVNGITGDQVLEILKLSKEDDEEEDAKKSRPFLPIIIAVIGTIGVIVAGYLGFRGPIEAALIPIRATQTAETKTQLAVIPKTGRSPTPEVFPPTHTPTSMPTSTYTSTATATATPTATITPTPTSTNTPTSTFTPTPEVLFTDTFEDYDYSVNKIKWNTVFDTVGKVYERWITNEEREESDNKFVHSVECQSNLCVGRNVIPDKEFKNFVLSFEIEYEKVPPDFSTIPEPFFCVNFRRYDPMNYYALCFKTDGNYRMARYYRNVLTVKEGWDWQESPLIIPGPEKNTIRITANRDNFIFEVNGEVVGEFIDDNLLSASTIEFAIYSFQDVPDPGVPKIESFVKLKLDNIEIINIP
jgi:hypothetical protein